MKQTFFIRLQPDERQYDALLETMRRFNQACNHIASVAYKLRTDNKVMLQKKAYRQVREQFGLSAQMAIRAIAKVSEAYKRDRSKKPTFKSYGAMVYDQRILSWKAPGRVSILTLKGRILVPVLIGKYQKTRIANGVHGQADLIFRDRKSYLAVVVDAPEAIEYHHVGHLGVDLGIVNLAVDSDGETHKGKDVDRTVLRIDRIRTKLQACGSKSARRHLTRLGRHEARYRRNVNHVVSKRLVAKAKDTRRMIILEDLRGMRNGITVRKAQSRRHNSWSFNQLRTFIEYKAKVAGVPIVFVNPRILEEHRIRVPAAGCKSNGTAL
jgi:IS605 OrfB family transposase